MNMKLIMAVIHDEDANRLMQALNQGGFSVTKLASTGGFLRSGNTTVFLGVDPERIDDAIAIIEKECKSRRQMTPANHPYANVAEGYIPYPVEVTVGGATIFVVDVEEFKKI